MIKHYLLIITLLLISLCNSAQEKVAFNGVLTDIAGTPIRKAHVYVKSARDFAITNKAGEFGLTNVLPTDTLKIEIKKDIYTVPVDGKRSMRIRLGDRQNIQTQEDEMLVDLGFGFISRREHTGVSNYISGEELRRSGYNDIISALQGRVSGLNVVGTSGQGGNYQDVSMRGTRSFTADATPAYVLNNVIVPSFEGVNLNDVDYVEVMKEASVYGANGANGAIIVHLKK